MSFFRVVAWVVAVIMTLGCISLLADYEFDIYSLMGLVYSWLVVLHVEKKI